MTFPLINKYKVYIYNGEEVVVRHQDLFKTVYLQTIVNSGESHFITVNWWDFAFKAHFAYELTHSKYEEMYRESIKYI